MSTEINPPSVTDEKNVTDVTDVKTPNDIVGEYFDKKAEEQEFKRLHVNIDAETAESIRKLRQKYGTATNVVRHAIELAAYLYKAVDDGYEVQTYNPKTHRISTIHLL